MHREQASFKNIREYFEYINEIFSKYKIPNDKNTSLWKKYILKDDTLNISLVEDTRDPVTLSIVGYPSVIEVLDSFNNSLKFILDETYEVRNKCFLTV